MRSRSTAITLFVAAAVVAAVPGSILAQGKGPGELVTLRLAAADPEGRQSDPAIRYLVERMAELSGGTVVIEPTYDAGADTPEGFEEGVARLLVAGDTDLAMIGSRAWPLVGVTSLQGFHAPFLVDNDALALAVAGSDTAARALASMGQGVTGLAMWPEDLRHIFAFGPGGADFSDPTAFQGETILAVDDPVAEATIIALGAEPYQEGVATAERTGIRGNDVDSGALKGMIAGLLGVGLTRTDGKVAGDLVIAPKLQTLVANDVAFDRLTDVQRGWLMQAADETQDDAFGRQPVEAELATRLCAIGATVFSVGPETVAAFQDAVGDVITSMEQDAFTRQVIAEVRELKAGTPPSPGAGECVPPDPADPVASSVPADGFIGDRLVPPGSYRAEMTFDELTGAGASPSFASPNVGTWTWTFGDGTWSAEHGRERCNGPIEPVDGVLRASMAFDGGCGMEYIFRWREVDGGIEVQFVGLNVANQLTDQQRANERAFLERVWERVE